MALFDFLTQDIAIDLGTANTIIIHNEKVVVDQPSIVAVDRTTGKVIAVGKQAQMMHGKTHENIKTIIVRIAVATVESVLTMPILANIAVIPVKSADNKENKIHIIMVNILN